MKKIFLCILISSSSLAILDYDRAIVQSQKNNWPATQELLTQVIVEQPERPDALYDLGVAAYKNHNFDTALSYFNKTANHKDASIQLQQQAHFNAGNAHVQLKQLHEAIAAYDRVLDQKPDHKEALHNKEVVKKMLEQQKQSADDKSKEDKENEQDKDKQNEDNKQDKDQKENQSQDKNNDSKDKQKKDNQQNQQNKPADAKAMADRQDQNNEQTNSDQSNADESENKKNESGTNKEDSNQPDEKDGQSEQPKKQSGNQQSSASKEDKQAKNQQKPEPRAGTSTPEQKPGTQNPEHKLSAGLARVLEDREKKDAQLNKKMTKALVANQGGSKNDYNCW